MTGTAAEREVLLPYYPRSGRNPYQDMLYARCASAGIEPRPLKDLTGLHETPAGELTAVLHVHWTDSVLQGASGRSEAKARLVELELALDRFVGGGGRLIWTVHNTIPHETRFADLEARVCQAIADRASAVHVMCELTADAVGIHYALPPDRLAVIPHSSYLGVYPNYVPQQEARARLGLDAEATVLTAFGGVRPYKGLTPLLDAFEAATARDPGLRLLIAGKPIRLPDLDLLRSRCDRNPSVLAHFEGVPAGQIQLYMNAADAVILPHRKALNSGLVALANSFGRPVIAPDLGCISSQVSAETGVLYEPGEPEALAGAIAGASALKHPRFSAAALERARRYPPESMAQAFVDLVRRVCAGGYAAAASDSANRPSGSVHHSVSSRPASA